VTSRASELPPSLLLLPILLPPPYLEGIHWTKVSRAELGDGDTSVFGAGGNSTTTNLIHGEDTLTVEILCRGGGGSSSSSNSSSSSSSSSSSNSSRSGGGSGGGSRTVR